MFDSNFVSFSKRLLDFISSPPDQYGQAEQIFNRLALELFSLQFEHVPVYRSLCEARGVNPKTIEDWGQIPAVPAAAFKQFDLSSLSIESRRHVFHSSGTTGQTSSQHYHNADSLRIYEASLLPWFKLHLLPERQMENGAPGSLHRSAIELAALTPAADDAPHSSLVHMFETVRNSFGLEAGGFYGRVDRTGGWTLDLERASGALLSAIEKAKPVLILTTAFSLVNLLDYCEAEGLRLRLPQGSRLMETGGYKGRSRIVEKAALQSMTSERLGLALDHFVSEYGMCELGSQAYDHVCGTPRSVKAPAFRFPPWARVRLLSTETGKEAGLGEPGLIQIVDLANVYSVAAVQTEDLAIRSGHGFELLGRQIGAAPRGCSLMTP